MYRINKCIKTNENLERFLTQTTAAERAPRPKIKKPSSSLVLDLFSCLRYKLRSPTRRGRDLARNCGELATPQARAILEQAFSDIVQQ